MSDKKNIKQWIFRYLSIALLFCAIGGLIIASSKAKYHTSISGTDTARVAKWAFTLNDEIMVEHEEVLDLLKDSYFTNVSNQENHTYASSLVPGMNGQINYLLQNVSEVDAVLTGFSIAIKMNFGRIDNEKKFWTAQNEWKTWLNQMPIDWSITILDTTTDGINSNEITIPMDGTLTGLTFICENEGTSNENYYLKSDWEILPDGSYLDFDMSTSYKVVKINWNWPYERTTPVFTINSNNYTISQYEAAFMSLYGVELGNEPSFNVEEGSKLYSQMTTADYNYLYHTVDQTEFDKYLSYKDYIRWITYYKYNTTETISQEEYDKRQTEKLEDIDNSYASVKMHISIILDFKVEQKGSTI